MTELNERMIKLSIQNDIITAGIARQMIINEGFDIYGKLIAYDYEDIIDESCVAVASILNT